MLQPSVNHDGRVGAFKSLLWGVQSDKRCLKVDLAQRGYCHETTKDDITVMNHLT